MCGKPEKGRHGTSFNLWLWYGDLYRVSPFQVYRTSTSCLPRDLEFFKFAVMKTFVTDISASTGRNDFIFDMWIWHSDLYFKTRCCMLCRAKNTPTRSFVSNLYISQHSLPENAVKT
jgi:hypothetical protein